MQSSNKMLDSQENYSWSVSVTLMRRIWVMVIVGSLVVMWCVLDSWNHDMSSELFQISGTDIVGGSSFKYMLTLAFLQFLFMAVVFCSMFAAKAASAGESAADHLVHVWPTLTDGKWPALVGTHVLGSVLLQSLMMPQHMFSLGLFAASRAFEVPVAAVVRAKVFGGDVHGPSLRTTMLMFNAAYLLFFSYTQISECLCVWSGHGVALTGVALYVIYGFLLTIPATNVVLQESVLVQLEVDPILMQGIQNLGGAVLLLPVLLGAHCLGFEDVHHAFAVLLGNRAVFMTVLWLCVQSALLSAVTVGLISTTNSFWTVAARCLRVVFWWGRQLVLFYLSSNTLLSVASPHASVWSFVMILGIVLAFTALITDRQSSSEPDEKTLLPIATGLGVGKYV